MVHRADQPTLVRKSLAVHVLHRAWPRQELRQRVTADRHDYARVDGRDLCFEKRVACGDLVLFGIAIPGGPMLDHIGDEHVASREPGRFQELIQKLARGTHEGPTLLVLIEAWRLANQND